MFKRYYYIVKPGIIYGNSLSVAAGFLLASRWHNLLQLLTTIAGVGLVIASACVFNNIIDRDIDAKMSRTKKRAMVVNSISTVNAVIYATILAIIGFGTLAIFSNYLTVLIGLIGFVDYVILYGYFKRKTHHGTLVGSISGAMPLVAGYTSATNQFGFEAVILFAIMTFWQMPHFFAIALRRSADYDSAKIPVLPLVKGRRATKIQMVFYIAVFAISCVLLSIKGEVGYSFLVVMITLNLIWLKIALDGFTASDDKKWAKKVFIFSLIILLSLSVMLSVGPILP